MPLAGAWFIADSVAARRRYQAGLAAQAERERAAEVREERVRIAREMHDVVAHALAVMTVQAGVGRCLAGQRPAQASAAFGSIETIGRTAQDELRVVLGLLRDGEVLVLVARGLSNAELAAALHVTLPTAKTHVSRILTKLGARDRTQLVILAYESGILTRWPARSVCGMTPDGAARAR